LESGLPKVILEVDLGEPKVKTKCHKRQYLSRDLRALTALPVGLEYMAEVVEVTNNREKSIRTLSRGKLFSQTLYPSYEIAVPPSLSLRRTHVILLQ
jgi:hypothetical protein